MKKIMQTRTWPSNNSNPPGNCFQACVASVLGLPLRKVPDPKDSWKPEKTLEESWDIYWKTMQKWFRGKGFLFLEFSAKGLTELNQIELDGLQVFITGPSPRNKNINHCTVGHIETTKKEKGKVDIKSIIDHDPHESGECLLSETVRGWSYGVLVRFGKI